jgi:hypothetical protein
MFPAYALRIAQDPSLSADDHVKSIGDDNWYLVRELRQHLNATRGPDPYAGPLAELRAAELRAAESTPESRFAEQWQAQRVRDMETMRASLDAESTPRLKTLTMAELAEWRPPNPYEEGIKTLRAKLK